MDFFLGLCEKVDKCMRPISKNDAKKNIIPSSKESLPIRVCRNHLMQHGSAHPANSGGHELIASSSIHL